VEYHPHTPAVTRRLLNIEPRNRTDILPITYFNVSNEVAQIKYDEERPIPKIIHQIWMGDIAKAPLEHMFGCKDLATQNGWSYKLWDDEAISNELLPRMINANAFSKFPNPHGKSDILRYEILYHWGGVYVDADTVCFRYVLLVYNITILTLCNYVLDHLICCCPKPEWRKKKLSLLMKMRTKEVLF
jgi:mannosyltransferase OCH1-like enzyme